MKRKPLILSLVSSFILLLIASCTTPESTSPFGMNVHLGLRFQEKEGDHPNPRELAADLLIQARVTWIREEFCWNCIEPWPHEVDPRKYRWEVYNYFDYDASIDLASEQGFYIMGLLTYGPRTNVNTHEEYDQQNCNMDPSAAPIDDWLPAWREFVREVITKYGNRIHYWQIQNEPNEKCFWRKVDFSASSPNTVDYVKILKAAYEEIHRADPHAQVLLAGLTPMSESHNKDNQDGVDYFEYLEQINSAGGWPYFDILAIHPYRGAPFPEKILPRSWFNVKTLQYQAEPNQYNFTDEIAAFEQLMSHWGKKPIWITEIGWTTKDLEERAEQRGTQPEIVQSDYLIRTYVQAIAAGVQNVMWYDFRDDAYDPERPKESSFGIIQRDFTPKPAYYGFSVMSSLLEGSEFQKQVRGQDDRNRPGDDDVYEYRFSKGTQTIIALWKAQGGDVPRTVQVNNIDAPTVQIFGPDFGPTTLDAGTIVNTTNGEISLELTERPIFITSAKIDARVVEQPGVLSLKPQEHSSIHFDVQNIGAVAWAVGQGFLLENINDETLGAPSAYPLDATVSRGQVTRWEIPIVAPKEVGSYNTKWQMTYDGKPFGPVMSCQVLVRPEGDIEIGIGEMLKEWFSDLIEHIKREINKLLEDLWRRIVERIQHELERLWREFWDGLLQQCCGANAAAPAVLLLGAWGFSRTARKDGER